MSRCGGEAAALPRTKAMRSLSLLYLEVQVALRPLNALKPVSQGRSLFRGHNRRQLLEFAYFFILFYLHPNRGF